MMAKTARLEAVCARHDVPLRAAALQFPLAHPAVAAVIPGACSPWQAEANRRLLACPLPAAFWQAVRAEGLVDPAAPLPK